MVTLQIALAGLLGTLAMIATMELIHHAKWANADMIRAIGSLFTRNLDNAYFPGLIAHCTIGVAFAFLYALVICHAPEIGPGGACALGALLGLVHGAWVGLLLVVEVAEYHPLAQFREAGIGVAVAHAFGHMVYGLAVGGALSLGWVPLRDAVQQFNPGIAFSDFVGFTSVALPLIGIPLAFAAYVSFVAYLAWRRPRRVGH